MRILIAIMLFISLAYAETTYAEPKPSFENPRKVIFSVTEDNSRAFDHILSVANNVLKFYGPENVEMIIVAYSQGIRLLNRHFSPTAVRVDALMQYGVTFVACGNTMRTLNIKEEDLVEGSEIVTAGVVELIERINSGWTYIKP